MTSSSNRPVDSSCSILITSAWTIPSSVYVSACMGKEIYFRETECLGQGAKGCSVIGRDAESWGDELRSIREDFQAANLGQEVERLREAVGRRVKELDLTPTGARLRAELVARMSTPPAAIGRLSARDQRELERILSRLLE